MGNKSESILNKLTNSNDLPSMRKYYNAAVKFLPTYTEKERSILLQKAGLNVFNFPAKAIKADFLSDSGTTTMTLEQWSELMLGDESYGSNQGYYELMIQIQDTFGKDFVSGERHTLNGDTFLFPEAGKNTAFLFHQGRSAENALFSTLGRTNTNMIIPSNGHFDTTRANIESNQIIALDFFSDELKDKKSDFLFKGNMNIEKLTQELEKNSSNIPLIYITITNNTGGGQPVSLSNIQETSKLAKKHDIPLFIDGCRFAENAWFIKKNEKSYQNKTIKEIVLEIFSYADGFSISFKKDGLSNMGGGLFFRNNGLFINKYKNFTDDLTNFQILTEGHPTYGGMSGRDLMALKKGLEIVTTEEYLDSRIEQIQYFGETMKELGLPIIAPVGGHAVYLDMNLFFQDTNMKPEEFGGIAFTAILLEKYGIRACELGNFAFGYLDKNNQHHFPENNFVRFAVPRNRLSDGDLKHVAHCVKELYTNRKYIPKIKVTFGEKATLRHFKASFQYQD